MALKKKSTKMMVVVVVVEVEGKGWAGKPGQCQGLSGLRGRSGGNKVMMLHPVLTHHLGPWGSSREMVDYLSMKMFVTRVVVGSVQWLGLQPSGVRAGCTVFCISLTKAEVRNIGSQIRLLNFFFLHNRSKQD